jgi:hypothetical protein
MNALPTSRHLPSGVEPLFRPEVHGRCAFELSGHAVTMRVEPGWLTGSVPISGSPLELLRRQTAIWDLAKVAIGPSLQVDVPLEKTIEESYTVLHAALEYGLRIITEIASSPACHDGDAQHAIDRLDEYFTSSPWEWSQEGESFLVKVEAVRGVQKIACEVTAGYVHFHAELVRLRTSEAIPLNALTHYLLALNAEL